MAKDSWLTVSPMSGEGNATLSNRGTIHSGRIQRSTTVTAVVTGIDAGKSYQVNQKPTAENLTIDTLSFNVGEEQSTVTITGKSNSPKITFSLGTGNEIPITLPTTYIANGLSTENGANIAGDPGADQQFVFSATVIVPKNTIGQRVGKIVATGSVASVTSTVTITQATSTYTVQYSKGDYINTINKASEKINYGGTATATATLLANTVQYSYSFDGWYEGSVKVGSDLVLSISNISSDRIFTAIGKRTLNRYTLSFTYLPTGGGTATGAGTYDYGTNVNSTATPATGYNFTKWVRGDGQEFTENPLSIPIDGDKTFQVLFTIKSYVIGTSEQYRVAESGEFTTGTVGGTVSGGGSYNHGSSVTLVATPATGYLFAGWYEGSSEVSTDASYTFTATGARTLVARFQRQWFTITFSAGTGGNVVPTSSRVEYGGQASSTATASPGYTFSGWNNGTETATLTVTNVTENATYAASFGLNVYVVTYTASTGVASVAPTSESVEHGSDAEGSTATLAAGYNFDGWYNGDTRVSTSLTYAPTNVTSNLTLTAKGVLKTFSITGTAQHRDTDSTGDFTTGTAGGSVTGSGTYNYGSKATLTASAATGYTFLGWFTSGGTSVGTDASYVIDSVTADVTVYARFQKMWFTITYNKGTGIATVSKASERVAYNGSTANVTATLSTGYTGGSWMKTSGTANLTTSGLTASLTAVQSDVVLTASAILQSFTVSYTKNANIASLTKTSESVNYGGTATCTAALPANTAQYTYSFAGWYEGSIQVSTALALSVANITSARTFEARGTATVNRYTITVNNGSGGGTYDYGTTVTLTASTITGKTFSKWSDGVTSVSRQITVTGNATYTAEFTDNYYTVTYGKGTGVATISRASESVIHGGNALGSTATVSTGYTFDGWYNGETRVSTSLTYAPTNVTSSMTLTAQATINRYTVTPTPYYRTTDGTGNYTSGTEGGTVSGGGTVDYGGTVVVVASAAAGYIFDGWYSEGASGGALLSSSASYTMMGIARNDTVYARFTRRYFTITYVAGDYVSSLTRTSERVAYGSNAAGSTMTPLATTAQYSYAVDGWYNGASKITSAAAYAPTNVTADATYTAKCTRTLRAYTVSYAVGSYIASVSRASESVNYGSNALGSTATIPASDAQYYYGFDGWYFNGTLKVSTDLTFGPANVTEDMSLEARGTRTLRSYNISVSLESSSSGRGLVSTTNTPWAVSNVESFAYGGEVAVGVRLDKPGDVFDGWYEGNTRVSTSPFYSFTCTGARTLVAKILYIDVDPASLSYDSNGGTQTVTVKSNIDSWTVS